MCDPATILTAIGFTAQAFGQVQGGRAANAAAKSNAAMFRMKSEDARQRGKAEEDRVRRKGEALKGQQIAQLAANGVVINTGSASDLIADTAMFAELDALTIRSNVEREIFFNEFAARSELAQGENIRSQSLLAATGTLLTGAGQSYAGFKKWDASQIASTESKIVT